MLIVTFWFVAYMIDILVRDVYGLELIILIICSSVFLLWLLLTYIKMLKEPRQLLRRIANIIIDDLAKNK